MIRTYTTNTYIRTNIFLFMLIRRTRTLQEQLGNILVEKYFESLRKLFCKNTF